MGPMDTDADRILRLTARFIGVGYVFFALALSSFVQAGAPAQPVWWTPVAVGIVFGPGIWLAVIAGRATLPHITRCADAAALGYLAVACTWPLTWTGAPLAQMNWLTGMPGLPALAVAMVRPPRWSLAYLATAIGAAEMLDRYRSDQQAPSVPEAVYGFAFSLIFVATVLTAIRTGRTLDETRAAARSAAASAAAMRARERARRRHAGLLHDWVLTSLLAAARQPHADGLRRQAEVTLAKLAEVDEDAGQAPLRAQPAVAELGEAATEVGTTVAVSTGLDPGATGAEYPADVVRAMAAGVSEAVRNSARHAGAAASCRVDIRAEVDTLAVSVTDDGVGFDPTAVGLDRYGARESLRRIEEIPGGTVRLDSRPGGGTRVHLGWTRPRGVEQQPPGIRALLGIDSRAAQLVAATYLVGTVCEATMFQVPGPTMAVALAWNALCVAALLLYPKDPIPRPVALTVALGIPAADALVLLTDPQAFASNNEIWPVWTFIATFTFLCIGGRAGFAWLGEGLVMLVVAVWALRTGHHAVGVVTARLPDFAPIAMATFFARTLRPAARRIYDLRTDSLRTAAAEAASAASIAESRRQLGRLDGLARTLLTRIADDQPLTARERREARLLEAHLRATLRAPGLVHPLVNRSVHDARERGVEVLLYDELGLDAADDTVRERILRRLADELDGLDSGTAVVRIRPPRRDTLVSYVVAGPQGPRRVEFGRDGNPLDLDRRPGRSRS